MLGKDETLPLSGITYSPQYFYEDEEPGCLHDTNYISIAKMFMQNMSR